MKISWINISDRITHELQQLEEEGHHVAKLRNEWKELLTGNDETTIRHHAELLYNKIETFNDSIESTANEPSEWSEIVRICRLVPDRIPGFSQSLIHDRIYGGWIGRSAGCLLGKPIEKISRTGAIELLSSNGTWPITDYITAKGIPNELLLKYPWNRHYGKESLRENIVCMPEDDDMNYPMMNLYIAEHYGESFTTENIIQSWLEMLPVLSTFSAERVAYKNALEGHVPPATATIRNPYREWIGAQIRADVWGWISPGQPIRAAEFACRDARLSHVRNGIYGEMFFSAAIAASFTHNTVHSIVQEAAKVIPKNSRFAEAIQFVMNIPIQKQSWDTTVNMLYGKYGKYHWVHTINNAALVVAALLSSNGDYEKAVCNVVMGGWDTDSNGATVGSIMGTMLGAGNLPPKWTTPIHNTVRTSLKGFDNSLFSDLSKRTASIARYTKQ